MSTPAETSGTPSPLSDWLEEDLAEMEAYGCPCSCKAPEETGARRGYTCPWHRAMQSLRRGVARLTAEREEARDDLRRECEASEHHRTARDAAEARAARAEEERDEYELLIVDVDHTALRLGRRYGLSDRIDNDGAPYTSEWADRLVQRARARQVDARALTEGADRHA